jgi:hypothetical protein
MGQFDSPSRQTNKEAKGKNKTEKREMGRRPGSVPGLHSPCKRSSDLGGRDRASPSIDPWRLIVEAVACLPHLRGRPVRLGVAQLHEPKEADGPGQLGCVLQRPHQAMVIPRSRSQVRSNRSIGQASLALPPREGSTRHILWKCYLYSKASQAYKRRRGQGVSRRFLICLWRCLLAVSYVAPFFPSLTRFLAYLLPPRACRLSPARRYSPP